MTTTFTDNKSGASYTTDFHLGEVVEASLGDKKVRGKIVQFLFGRHGAAVGVTTINGEGNVQGINVELDDLTHIAEG